MARTSNYQIQASQRFVVIRVRAENVGESYMNCGGTDVKFSEDTHYRFLISDLVVMYRMTFCVAVIYIAHVGPTRAIT